MNNLAVDVRDGRLFFRYSGSASLDDLSVFLGVSAGGLSSLPTGAFGGTVSKGCIDAEVGRAVVDTECDSGDVVGSFCAARYPVHDNEGGDCESRAVVECESCDGAFGCRGESRGGAEFVGQHGFGGTGGGSMRRVGGSVGGSSGDFKGCCCQDGVEFSGDAGEASSVVGDKGRVADVVQGCAPVESNTERNRRWRQERKDRKKKRQLMSCDWRKGGTRTCSRSCGERAVDESSSSSDGEAVELRKSLERKWRVENELAVEKAERKLAVLRANDVAEESKQYRARVLANTEKTKVSIERAYAELAGHGDVPGVVGSAETVVSGGKVPGLTKGSISPNSSASMAEFHAQQKALFDSEARVKELEDKLARVSQKVGFDCTLVDYMDKKTWTDTSENREILGRLMPGGYGMEDEGMPEGKFKPMYCGPDWY